MYMQLLAALPLSKLLLCYVKDLLIFTDVFFFFLKLQPVCDNADGAGAARIYLEELLPKMHLCQLAI